ncbi:ENTH/VHS domain-containing protein [Schizosaccharomyces japonicus yFS275]|uniref:ENTH/VHS domain-containing protein n=1 Tax=Schizosaccharomyces japonicus (strain yFS275 / FY16936) TaxID=402676 RepID=B6JWE8_SCHJY|nr:ENTH/VHS domain-containing protein [Schizosaccharomyces japonicus yFS275]EEB05699.1 ENTH/VHS domain-containing protein [Schizosaccharomyces japonicus yFS275]
MHKTSQHRTSTSSTDQGVQRVPSAPLPIRPLPAHVSHLPTVESTSSKSASLAAAANTYRHVSAHTPASTHSTSSHHQKRSVVLSTSVRNAYAPLSRPSHAQTPTTARPSLNSSPKNAVAAAAAAAKSNAVNDTASVRSSVDARAAASMTGVRQFSSSKMRSMDDILQTQTDGLDRSQLASHNSVHILAASAHAQSSHDLAKQEERSTVSSSAVAASQNIRHLRSTLRNVNGSVKRKGFFRNKSSAPTRRKSNDLPTTRTSTDASTSHSEKANGARLQPTTSSSSSIVSSPSSRPRTRQSSYEGVRPNAPLAAAQLARLAVKNDEETGLTTVSQPVDTHSTNTSPSKKRSRPSAELQASAASALAVKESRTKDKKPGSISSSGVNEETDDKDERVRKAFTQAANVAVVKHVPLRPSIPPPTTGSSPAIKGDTSDVPIINVIEDTPRTLKVIESSPNYLSATSSFTEEKPSRLSVDSISAAPIRSSASLSAFGNYSNSDVSSFSSVDQSHAKFVDPFSSPGRLATAAARSRPSSRKLFYVDASETVDESPSALHAAVFADKKLPKAHAISEPLKRIVRTKPSPQTLRNSSSSEGKHKHHHFRLYKGDHSRYYNSNSDKSKLKLSQWCIDEKRRTAYEALWASNKGYMMLRNDDKKMDDMVCNIVVRDLWARSGIPFSTLAQIYNLVSRDRRPWLTRDEFVVGMFLIDQYLAGRKLPSKVPDSVWISSRRMGDLLWRLEKLKLSKERVKNRKKQKKLKKKERKEKRKKKKKLKNAKDRETTEDEHAVLAVSS